MVLGVGALMNIRTTIGAKLNSCHGSPSKLGWPRTVIANAAAVQIHGCRALARASRYVQTKTMASERYRKNRATPIVLRRGLRCPHNLRLVTSPKFPVVEYTLSQPVFTMGWESTYRAFCLPARQCVGEFQPRSKIRRAVQESVIRVTRAGSMGASGDLVGVFGM